MKHYIGIDLGGTNIVAGLVDKNYTILKKLNCKTNAPRPAEEIYSDIVSLCYSLLRSCHITLDEIEWIGVGSPGIINGEVIEYANNLEFHQVPLSSLLEQKMQKKVYLQNDANAAAYGEFLAGAGKGHHSLIAVTLGTGVGGGIIIDDKICSGFNGAGAELGHTIIEANGRLCTCGKQGCLEAYCSATALQKATREAMIEHPESSLWTLCRGELPLITGKTAFDGMRQNDPIAIELVKNFIFHLSIGVSNMVNLLQPEILCIGGGISGEGDAIINPLRKLVDQQTYIHSQERSTQIVTAQLGNDAGLIGAAMLGKQA